MGLMVVPLTAGGATVDGRRLSSCLWSCRSRAVPPTLIPAPESGRASTLACLLREDMWTLIVGADSKVTEGQSFVEAISGVVDMCVPGAVNVGEVGGLHCWAAAGGGGRCP